MNYLKRLLDTTDPSASLRHAAYALAVVASVCWLTWGARKDIDSAWVSAFGLFLAAVVTGKVAGKAPSGASVVPGSSVESNGGTNG